MADVNNSVGVTGSYFIDIDSDNDSTTQTFKVTHHSGAETLLTVTEDGRVTARGKGDFSSGSIRTTTSQGAPSGGEVGDIVVDTTNTRLYVKFSSGWAYVQF